MTTTPVKIDMTKMDLRKQIVLNLKKNLGIETEKAQVVLVLDYSGSMLNEYRDGTVQELCERILALALNFDDDGQVPFYLFHNSFMKEEDIQLSTISTIVSKAMRHSMGGTNYAPVSKALLQEYLGAPTMVSVQVPKKGVFGFGTKMVEEKILGYQQKTLDTPVYVIFVTDGQCMDSPEMEKVMKASSHTGVFFQFVGIGQDKFEFLEKLDDLDGRLIDNANFLKVPNLKTTSDESLYKMLLAEYPSWLPQARKHNLIK